jgi:hypothetical protein
MPNIPIYPASQLITGYNVDNSLRFNQPDNPYLTRTISSAGSATTVSISFWFKRGKLADDLHIFSAKDSGVHASSIDEIKITSGDILRVENYNGSGYNYRKLTNRVFRDPSAWYHILVVYDTSNATADDRIRIYINGVRETSFSTSTNPSQNNSMYYFDTSDPFIIGTDARTLTGASNLDGYLSEIAVVDGTALNTTDVGEFDEDSGIWKPIDVSGLTFGTNGFYLDFEDSSSLGNDVSGNNNDFTVNNLTSIDQTTDTCTNNYCTWNSLDNYYTNATLSDGNTIAVTSISDYSAVMSTIGVNSGKWYCEIKVTDVGDGYTRLGIKGRSPTSNTDGLGGSGRNSFCYTAENGDKISDAGQSSYGNTFTNNDIIGIAVDLDNNYIYFSKNGTWQNSGDPESGSSGTGAAFNINISPESGFWFISGSDASNSANSDNTYQANFGNPPFSISSGNSDGNGYGNFEYSVPSGYYALNTKNLAEYG